MKKIKIKLGALMAICLLINSCQDYLNVAPDNIATLDYAFAMRSEAQKYLYTCYSYMTYEGDRNNDPALFGGDDHWSNWGFPAINILKGYQSSNAPLCESWTRMYQGIRVCNIFLENVEKVPDLPAWERKYWEGEVIFLKAWYHFNLIRMYGPIPLVKESLPISASPDDVKVSRAPVDECFDYIIELLDLAMTKLPETLENPNSDLGRITVPIVASIKAKVLATAASPLFNGNTDQAGLKNKDGAQLFNTTYDPGKWQKAFIACKEAIDICHRTNHRLYKYQTTAELSDTIVRELTIRSGFTAKWNSGIIWANTLTRHALRDIVQNATANLDSRFIDDSSLAYNLQPPVKTAEMYYTNHGVPIAEDKEWKSIDPFELRVGTEADQYYIKKGYTTIQLHFNREPRFYASLGFDGGIWYGQRIYGNNPDEYFYIACRVGGAQQRKNASWGPITGYFWKKCVHFENVQTATYNYSVVYYPWPIMRLADLYLLYAEVINEMEGPNGSNSAELFEYIDRVRENAGLKGVKYSWDNYADNQKYNTPSGMRQIIHRERMIELSLEGQRFWDLRRWKEVHESYSTNIEGYKILESDPEKFYQRVVLWKLKFNLKDYFWPIKESDIEQNPNLVQNIGW